MFYTPRTRIVATIGPSTWSEDILRKMFEAGVSVARINASFADHAEFDRVSTLIRSISPKVALMMDTMGHKIRVSGFDTDMTLTAGETIALVPDGQNKMTLSSGKTVSVTYAGLLNDIKQGDKILFDDGTIICEITEVTATHATAKVLTDGILKPKKTVNFPGIHLNLPALSKKDEDDIEYAVANDFDFIAASFVRNTEDVNLIKQTIGNSPIKLIAKIEDAEAVENFDKILEVVDGIMVARGDLGVELPIEHEPLLQKEFIKKCRNAGKPVIVATQMLESMRESPLPTRAEVTDIANAVIDGADALMLSAETSTGKYPLEAVNTMAKIAAQAEKDYQIEEISGRTNATEETDKLCMHLKTLTEELKLKYVVVLTKTGLTTQSISRHRLSIPIFSISNNQKILKQQSLLYGVSTVYTDELEQDRDDVVLQIASLLSAVPLGTGDKIAIISGSSVTGKTANTILEIVTVR